ncbi:MAG: 50S ribosomal protein L18e [Candidatus Micrarchaeaceae archaeon]
MKINAEKSVVREWLATLREASKGKRYGKLYKRAYELVEVPSRRRHEVSLSTIEMNTKEGDNVIVPGKVLSNGSLGHSVTISAMGFSASALRSLKDAKCSVVSIKDIVKSEKVRVLI